jgi:molybdopterin-guanine dinucleotide biosynthesis protein A
MSNHVFTILAGGFSRRFQKEDGKWLDKALLHIKEKPLLIHHIEKAKEKYDQISISVNSISRQSEYEKIMKNYLPNVRVKYTVDLQEINLDGVLRGIFSSLRNFNGSRIQFMPSDRPYLDLRILKGMDVEKRGVSLLQYENGMIEPLLALYGENTVFPDYFTQLPLSRADVPIRLSNKIQYYKIEEILDMNDLSSRIFTNVNVQTDIDDEEHKKADLPEISIPTPTKIKRESLEYSINYNNNEEVSRIIEDLFEIENYYSVFLLSLYLRKENKITAEEYNKLGIESLKKEHEFWINNEMPLLALHSLDDLVKYFPNERNSDIVMELEKLRGKMKIKPRRID